ncbi:MAG: S1 RNA-binding domain-containing protein, partial [Elusimicrobia bacterium]|nr:S1 RNA-binding domain-containing protein [Elusimicrobiota bacterium]
GQMILSRRAVLEEDAAKRREKVLGETKPGQVRVGRVVRVTEAGVLIDVGGLEGVLHDEDIAWKDAAEAKKKLERGAKLRVKVLNVEAEGGKVSLGLKQLSAHPADLLRKKYPIKAAVKGTVAEILKDGVRLKLAKGDAAFCPVRELPTVGGDPTRGRVDRNENLPPVWPKEGEEVGAIVIGVQQPSCEVMVSIRRYDAIQERKQVAKYMRAAPPLTLGQLLNPDAE